MSSVPLTQASSESPSNPSDLLTFYVAPKPNSPPAESALSALIAEQRRSKNGSGTASTAFEVGPGRKTNLAPNDFDVALTDFSTLPTHPSTLCTPASQTSLGWLDQWLKQNQSRLPSQRELQCLEGLTNLSGPFITNWLTQHSTTTSHLPKEENSSRSRVSIDDSTPQKKINYSSSTSSYSCLPCSSRPWQPTNPTSQPPPSSCPSNSCKPRPHSTKPLSPSSIPPTTKPNPPPVLYSCTQNCGFTTPRRHDWSRHERKRFEEWICPTPLCNASLTRKEKLRDHLRVVHGRGSSAPKSLDQCRREKQEGGGEGGKACGFCGRGFAEWKAWLGHVGDHFEADARGTSSAAAA